MNRYFCPPQSQWIASLKFVYQGSIFSHNMPAAHSTHLILLKPCHETALCPPCPSLLSVSVSLRSAQHKNIVPVGLSHTSKLRVLFYCWLLAEHLITETIFAVLERGKEDEGGVCTIMGADIRKWPSEIHSTTLTDSNASEHQCVRL